MNKLADPNKRKKVLNQELHDVVFTVVREREQLGLTDWLFFDHDVIEDVVEEVIKRGGWEEMDVRQLLIWYGIKHLAGR